MKKGGILFLFIIFCLLQISVLAYLTHKGISKGTEIKFQCRIYDPYDLIKGRYIQLSFEQETQSVSKFKNYDAEKKNLRRRETTIYCIVKEDDGEIIELRTTRPQGGLFFTALLDRYNDNWIYLTFPFNKYYMQENYAPIAESIIREKGRDDNTFATVSIDRRGNTRIVRMEIGGELLEDLVTEDGE